MERLIKQLKTLSQRIQELMLPYLIHPQTCDLNLPCVERSTRMIVVETRPTICMFQHGKLQEVIVEEIY